MWENIIKKGALDLNLTCVQFEFEREYLCFCFWSVRRSFHSHTICMRNAKRLEEVKGSDKMRELVSNSVKLLGENRYEL